MGKFEKRHGHRTGKKFSPTYRSWRAMLNRTSNPKHRMYEAYSSRGITVCDRWRDPPDGFRNFLADVGARPSVKHTLDRKDPNKGYEPGNCRWSTKNYVDGRGGRLHRAIGPDGHERELSLYDWATLLRIKYSSLLTRMRRVGATRAFEKKGRGT